MKTVKNLSIVSHGKERERNKRIILNASMKIQSCPSLCSPILSTYYGHSRLTVKRCLRRGALNLRSAQFDSPFIPLSSARSCARQGVRVIDRVPENEEMKIDETIGKLGSTRRERGEVRRFENFVCLCCGKSRLG